MDSQGTVAKPVSPTPPGSHGACDLEGIEATGFATDGQSTGENHVRSRIPATPKPVIPLLPYQLEDFESADRFRWNCWARQTGKSFTKSLRRIVRGLRRRRNQIFLSAGERQSRELMIKARQHCQALKIEFQALEDFSRHLNVQKMEIVLPGRVRIIGLPANPQTARGYTGDVLLDEFAMHAEDREIWAAIFPSLLRGDGELDIASTPRGHGNMFYHLRDNRMFAKSMISLPEAIAQGLDVDAEEVRRAIGDEELYRQEFLCEFLDEATAFLTYEQIGACVDKSLVPYATPMALGEDARELFVGVDIGRTHDLTAIWVLAKEKAEPRVDGAVGRKPIVGTGELHGHASVGHATQGGRGSDQLVTVGLWTLANAPFREQFDFAE